MEKVASVFHLSRRIFTRNPLITIFVLTHVFFAAILGRLYAFAPDEHGYLYTFNNMYGGKDPNPQNASGWITAPKPFLWIIYLPSKILTLCGIPDYFSIRLSSIALGTATIILLSRIFKSPTSGHLRLHPIFIAFFIPSIALWTVLGMRESFIMCELAMILAGLTALFDGEKRKAFILLVLGDYALLSTKSYLWICLVLSLLVFLFFLAILHTNRRKIFNLLASVVLLPSILFASTTSWYAFTFLVGQTLHTDITAMGARGGDSVLEISVPVKPGTSTGSTDPGSTDPGSTDPGSTDPGSTDPLIPTFETVTFHGDTTLIMLHFYLLDHPASIFTRAMNFIGFTSKIQEIWESKVSAGQVSKSKEVIADTSSVDGYILKTGDMHRAFSLLHPILLFLLGPFPFVGSAGVALKLVALESPLWWALYALLLFQFIRFRKFKLFQDPLVLFPIILLGAFVAFSALVEVNLGTSFRHRSIILVPIIYLYLRISSKKKEFSA
ncbi:MAG: hypothetical protein NT152_00825 [Actinobacteria bacterium]|nr:hypothetical protein [Actinomycetota bacterium]